MIRLAKKQVNYLFVCLFVLLTGECFYSRPGFGGSCFVTVCFVPVFWSIQTVSREL